MKSMTAAEFRAALAKGEAKNRHRGHRNLPEHVRDRLTTEVARANVARDEADKKRTPRGSGGKKCVVDGIKFPSHMEGRVYLRLKAEAARDGWVLFRPKPYPLTNLAPIDDQLRPTTISIDFELFHPPTGRRRFIDAKAKRWKSREWVRGKAAFETRYGHVIEECDR